MAWYNITTNDNIGDGSFTIGAKNNVGRNARESDITVSGTGAVSKTVTIKQSGIGLYLGVNDVTFLQDGQLVTAVKTINAQTLSNSASQKATAKVFTNAAGLKIVFLDNQNSEIGVNTAKTYFDTSGYPDSYADCKCNTINISDITYTPSVGAKSYSNGSLVDNDPGLNQSSNGQEAVCYNASFSVTFEKENKTTVDEIIRFKIYSLDINGNIDGTPVEGTFIHKKNATASLSLDKTEVTFGAGAGTAKTTETITVTSNIVWTVS